MILSIDLGGTKIQYAVFETNSPAAADSEPNFSGMSTTVATQKDFVGQLKSIITATIANHSDASNTKPFRCIAIGVPGPTTNNIMHGSRPLNVLDDFDFPELLSEFHLPVLVKNDLNMAAYCELYRGAGLSYKNFCLLALSTGIGLAAINNGRILQGRTEMGHQVFLPEFEPAQACTNHHNCWVSLASGSGIENRFSTDGHNTTESIFKHVLTSEHIAALKTMNAQALGSIVSAYDPEVIVIMGSLGVKQFDCLIPQPAAIESYTINRPIPAIVKTQFEKEIGVIGAYYAALEYLNNE
jgi:predicted NBD/HSP70 family sugar kinase